MIIYLIRHGDSVGIGKNVREDEYRYLTLNGRKTTYEAAKKLNRVGVSFDLILTSPLVRAIQSAEITASVLNYSGEIITASELLNGAPFNRFLTMLLNNSQYEYIACFGHNPDLTMYVRDLLKTVTIIPLYEMKKSSVCSIDYNIEEEKGSLKWILDPDDMKIIRPAE